VEARSVLQERPAAHVPPFHPLQQCGAICLAAAWAFDLDHHIQAPMPVLGPTPPV
jgi:hypothetical protein